MDDDQSPNPAFFDVFVDNINLPTLIRLYSTSSAWHKAIDNNLKRISEALGVKSLNSFRDVIEAYEKTVVELPFSIALPKAARYSVKLFQRVLYENPMPFVSDLSKGSYIHDSRNPEITDVDFDTYENGIYHLPPYVTLQPDTYDDGRYHLPSDDVVEREPYFDVGNFEYQVNYWTIPEKIYDAFNEDTNEYDVSIARISPGRYMSQEEKDYLTSYHDTLVDILEDKTLPVEVKTIARNIFDSNIDIWVNELSHEEGLKYIP